MRHDYACAAGEEFEPPQENCGMLNVFTRREAEIVSLIAQGRSSKEIATALKLSLWTVADHRKNICRKLDVHSTAELVYAALARIPRAMNWIGHFGSAAAADHRQAARGNSDAERRPKHAGAEIGDPVGP